jgi:DNA-binding MarR family transcriptional regulator
VRQAGRKWFFVTSHAFVLLQVERNPDITVREIAEQVGLTERQAHRVLADLVEEGYLTRERVGRRNRYQVNHSGPMRHPAIAELEVGHLLRALAQRKAS